MGLTPNDSRSGRVYDWDGRSYYSVTTVLGALNKPALPGWAARSVAEYVASNFNAVSSLVNTGQKRAAIDLMKGAPWRQRDAAADIGTCVHKAIELLLGGQDAEGYVTEVELPYVHSFVEWANHFKPEILVSEGTVFNREYDYAGTLDLIVRMDGLTWLVDVKSGKGVYPEHAMQVAAYARGEFIGHEDGTEDPLPIIDRGAVLHLQKDGYHFIPVNIGKEVYDSFLYCREMYRWQSEIADKALLPEVRK